MSLLTIDTIRTQYPHPSRDLDNTTDDPTTYCVGGAICRSARRVLAFVDVAHDGFPGETDLAWVLRDLNPDLDEDDDNLDIEETRAFAFASAIIERNESLDFAGAWDYAGQALAYRRPAQPHDARNLSQEE